MGNNNATAIYTEEETPKHSVSVETTQDQVFLAGEGKDLDEEKESSKLNTNGMSPLDSIAIETGQDQVFLVSEVKGGDEEKESSKLHTNGMSLSIETVQDQVFLVSEGKDEDKESLKLETNGMSLEGEGRGGDEEKMSSNLDTNGVTLSIESKQDQVFLAGEGKYGDKESLKIETNEKSPPWESVSVETKQEQVFLAAEEKDGDKERECPKLETNEVSKLDSMFIEIKQDQLFLAGEVKYGDEEKESLPEAVQEKEPHFKDSVDELKVKDQSGLESLVIETDEKLQTQTLVAEGLETVETEEKMSNESLDEVVHSEEDLKLDQETLIDEGIANKLISNSKPGSQESNMIQDTDLGVHKEEKDKIKENLKRMSRCRSLPVSQNSRVVADSLVQHLVKQKTNISETQLVSCIGSKKVQETIEEKDKEARLEMQSPNFGNNLRSDESTEKTPLLCQDKTEIYEATIDVEENTVMLKRSESVKTSMDRSLELLKKHSASFKETKGLEDNLMDKKGSSTSTVRKKSKSSFLGTCLCCTTGMN